MPGRSVKLALAALVPALAASAMLFNQYGIKEVMEMEETSLTLMTVYDNYPHNSRLGTGWGFSCVVKAGGNNILFDTGAESRTLLGNMEGVGIDPEAIDAVVLSHAHGDHTGGLEGFLKVNPDVSVYVLDSFPGGIKETVGSSGARLFEVSGPVEISEGVSTTGGLGDRIMEQSLVVNTDRGLVVLTGCAHPGIVDIVREARRLTGRDIHLVMGGFHLSGESDEGLRSIMSSLKELGVERAAPCHCSGERARELFSQEYGEDYIANGVGMAIEV
jgi:7,8-dihydropterin-6-yl-methyl-4-(beta-D-ribofuranosyl)aminobenzene 5'-phosphate synthase